MRNFCFCSFWFLFCVFASQISFVFQSACWCFSILSCIFRCCVCTDPRRISVQLTEAKWEANVETSVFPKNYSFKITVHHHSWNHIRLRIAIIDLSCSSHLLCLWPLNLKQHLPATLVQLFHSQNFTPKDIINYTATEEKQRYDGKKSESLLFFISSTNLRTLIFSLVN